MFDFEDLEEDPAAAEEGVDLETLGLEVVQRSAVGLEHTAWNLRRDACRELAEFNFKLEGSLVAPLLPQLRSLAASDEDYEVRKAARKALQALLAAGVEEPPAPSRALPTVDDGALAVEAGAPVEAPQAWVPRAQFEIFGEVLPMRLERSHMSPAEVAEIWERHWGVQYAGRIRFAAQQDEAKRWLSPKEDIVPRVPFVVRLDCAVGSILQTLRVALQEYGELSAEEASAERSRRSACRSMPPRHGAEVSAAGRGGGVGGGGARGGLERAAKEKMVKPWREGRSLLPTDMGEASPNASSTGARLPTLEELEGRPPPPPEVSAGELLGDRAEGEERPHRLAEHWARSDLPRLRRAAPRRL
mmetsp:Transcript_70623/g.190179  ORF Transcript_70623/g.190179 Transcript_70623/m.190179 type:complete len:359 (-) Transcript_70623:99-1175(-)